MSCALSPWPGRRRGSSSRCAIAATLPRHWERLSFGSSAGRIQQSLIHPRLRIRPTLFRFEPPSGLRLLFLLACLFLVMFLSARSGSIRHRFHSCAEWRCPALGASPSAASSSPPKNCPLCRSRIDPLGPGMDVGRRCTGFRWLRGDASGPKSRPAPPRYGCRGSLTRDSVAQPEEVSDGSVDAGFQVPGPASQASRSQAAGLRGKCSMAWSISLTSLTAAILYGARPPNDPPCAREEATKTKHRSYGSPPP